MNFRRIGLFCASVILVLTTLPSQVVLGEGTTGNGGDREPCRSACPTDEGPGSVRCHAWGSPRATTAPTGLSPAQIKKAYGFSTSATAGAGKTIAIVDAYDDPTAESQQRLGA